MSQEVGLALQAVTCAAVWWKNHNVGPHHIMCYDVYMRLLSSQTPHLPYIYHLHYFFPVSCPCTQSMPQFPSPPTDKSSNESKQRAMQSLRAQQKAVFSFPPPPPSCFVSWLMTSPLVCVILCPTVNTHPCCKSEVKTKKLRRIQWGKFPHGIMAIHRNPNTHCATVESTKI